MALGACIVEKHLTLSRDSKGPDSAFSLEPPQFKTMVEAIRIGERALGTISFGPGDHELASLNFRRSLFVVEDVKQGDAYSSQNIRWIRPAHGLHTRHLSEVLGCKAARNIERGTPLTWDLVVQPDTVTTLKER